MSALNKFITISILLIISRLYDVLTTYLYIPDLKGEANPLVSIFNFGWPSLIAIQIIGLGLVIYATYVYYFKSVDTIKVSAKNSLMEFISIFHFNTPNNFLKLFYKLPTNQNSLLYSLGGILSKGLIIFSIVVGTSTSLLINFEQYRTFYSTYHIPIILYLFSLLLIIYLSINFYKLEKQKRTNR